MGLDFPLEAGAHVVLHAWLRQSPDSIADDVEGIHFTIESSSRVDAEVQNVLVIRPQTDGIIVQQG